MRRARKLTARITTSLAGALALGVWAPASAHHSYAMYDGSIYKVFTGVIVRIVPNAAHFEMHFVPLNETRDALVRDEKGEQLVWVVQMESAAEAFQHGITRESFPQGTVIQHGCASAPRRQTGRRPRRLRVCSNARRARCPQPGKHCDSVDGASTFGEGEMPPEGPVKR